MAEKNQRTRLDDTVRTEQLKLVFAQAPLAIIISPVAAVTLALGIWQVADHGAAIAWVLVIRGWPSFEWAWSSFSKGAGPLSP